MFHFIMFIASQIFMCNLDLASNGIQVRINTGRQEVLLQKDVLNFTYLPLINSNLNKSKTKKMKDYT